MIKTHLRHCPGFCGWPLPHLWLQVTFQRSEWLRHTDVYYCSCSRQQRLFSRFSACGMFWLNWPRPLPAHRTGPAADGGRGLSAERPPSQSLGEHVSGWLEVTESLKISSKEQKSIVLCFQMKFTVKAWKLAAAAAAWRWDGKFDSCSLWGRSSGSNKYNFIKRKNKVNTAQKKTLKHVSHLWNRWKQRWMEQRAAAPPPTPLYIMSATF